MINSVIFDFDMTLVDSSQGITDCINAVGSKRGLPVVTRDDVLSIVGIPLQKGLHSLWGDYDEKWLVEYRAIFKETEYRGIYPFKNTVPTLDGLHDRGIKLAVATNRNEAEGVVRAVGLYEKFDLVLGLGGTLSPKPDPDVILAAVEKLGGDLSDSIYVGDTDIDMKAACNAGVRSVGMTTGNFDYNSLISAGAWKVLDDIEGLLDLIDGHSRGDS